MVNILQDVPYEETLIEKDAIYEYLIQPSDAIDSIAVQIIPILFAALVELLKRMVADQLPGGRYYESTEILRSETSSALPHNKLPEFTFGVLDFLLRYRPNASTIVNEAFMFAMNKTRDWLAKMDLTGKENLMVEARKEGRHLQKIFRERLNIIKEERLAALQKRAQEIKRKSEKTLKEKEILTEKIVHYGLWQSIDGIHAAINDISVGSSSSENKF